MTQRSPMQQTEKNNHRSKSVNVSLSTHQQVNSNEKRQTRSAGNSWSEGKNQSDCKGRCGLQKDETNAL